MHNNIRIYDCLAIGNRLLGYKKNLTKPKYSSTVSLLANVSWFGRNFADPVMS